MRVSFNLSELTKNVKLLVPLRIKRALMTVATFYDELAPYYHLIFPDWDASIARQAESLERSETMRLCDES